jgi:hypothetical protein
MVSEQHMASVERLAGEILTVVYSRARDDHAVAGNALVNALGTVILTHSPDPSIMVRHIATALVEMVEQNVADRHSKGKVK